MPAHTPRLSIPTPLSTEAPDAPTELAAMAAALDNLAPYGQGILAIRPTSSGGSPGIQGRLYYVLGDSTPANNGILWLDEGTGWVQAGSAPTIVDLRANRPSAAAVQVGQRFFATDQVAEWIATSAPAWVRVGQQCGVVGLNITAAATAGSLLLQGQSWPATTGIYADLYAFLGSPANVPDFGTFAPVGWKSGDSSFGTLLGTVGEKTHTLTVPELPAHHHDDGTLVVDGGAGAGRNYLDPTGSGHNTADTGSGAAHNTIQPSIAVNFEAKL